MIKLNVADYKEGQRWVCRKSLSAAFDEGKMYVVKRTAGGKLLLMGNNANGISNTTSLFVPFETPSLEEYE